MSTGSYWRIFTRQWLLVLMMTALCLGAAAVYSVTVTPTYSSSVRLFVAVRTASVSASEVTAAADYATRRVPSYVQLVDSPAVLTDVIDELNLPYSVTRLGRELSAKNPTGTVNLIVTVRDSDSARAAAIANAFAPRFAAYLASIERVGGSAQSTVQVSVTKSAVASPSPVNPKTPLNLVLGLFVGLGLGLITAYVRDQSRSAIVGVRDVEQLTGSVPLGVVPFDRSTSLHPLVSSSQQADRAEAFSGLRTNLQFANVDHPPGTVVITSASPGEGKSTCAANIALSLAVGGAAVALVEADMRNPTLSGYFGISNAAGLANVLAGQYSLDEVLIEYRGTQLSILPSGSTPPNPADLLNSTQMEKLLSALGERFDYVIVDSPPLLRFADAAALSAIADGTLLVLRNRRTKRDHLDRAIRSLTTVNVRVLGTVLNFAPAQKAEPYPRDQGSRRGPDIVVPQGNLFATGDSGSVPPTAGPAAPPPSDASSATVRRA